jgi:hypothetical protein
MKKNEIRIEYTETFNNLLNDLIDHLNPNSSEEQVIIRIARSESLGSFTSTTAPISQPLLELGVSTYREFTLDYFRLLYRIHKEEGIVRIIDDVMISQKQDKQQLLINNCLLHK